MRTFSMWIAAAVTLAACGGNVVVDGANGGSAPTTTDSAGGSGSTSAGGSVTTTSVSTSSGVASCTTCQSWFASGGDGAPDICPGASTAAWEGLRACACTGGPCASNCYLSFCTDEPIDPLCNACLMSTCMGATAICEAN